MSDKLYLTLRRALMRFFVRRYYDASYHPLGLQADGLGGYLEEHRLDGVPWIAAQEAVCQSTSLQMIAAQHGIVQPRRYFDFLMGFTYGASQIPGGLGFYPGTDPEPGFVIAAPYLGLERRFYVTDDAGLYLDALRYYLSQGYPVRVGWDMAVLYDGLEAAIPHSDVLVGYDTGGFYYYETVWAHNGHSLIGGARYGPPQGADVIDRLASQIEVRGTKVDATEIQPGLKTAIYVRQENATYLREAFPGEADLEKAATLFDQASDTYRVLLAILEDGIVDRVEARQVAGRLRAVAAAERAAGEILLAQSQCSQSA